MSSFLSHVKMVATVEDMFFLLKAKEEDWKSKKMSSTTVLSNEIQPIAKVIHVKMLESLLPQPFNTM